MDNVETLIDAYIDHTIDDDQFKALCDWLREDAANRQAFARKLALHSEIAEWCTERSGSPLAGDLQATEADAATQPHTWVDELAQLDGPATHADPSDDAGSLSAHDLAAVTGYALRLALTSTHAKRLYAYASVAAAIVLAVVLLGPWGGNKTPTDVPFADDPNDSIEPGPIGPALNTAVATLTAEHNAQWDSQPAEDLRRGSKLHPNQRLTLTQGFAEITTNRGAIAILEAPATIELLNNDNAIRLHTGKLVGICETDASKGFLVRTPDMDITDLGTRFAVYASSDEQTEVHVIEGEVEVARTSLAGGTVVRESIVAGDAVLASSSSDELTRIQTSNLRFATLLAFDADLSERRGLVAHWRFDDPQRLGLNAHRGIEDLQAQGDATHTPQGRFGGGLLLDGDGDALVAATFPDGIPTGGAAHTVALWIKPTATGRGGFYSWGTANRVDRSTGLRFQWDGVSHYFWEANQLNDLMATEQAVAGVGVDFTEGGWTHVALTWDGHTRKLYLNGLLLIEGIRQAPDVTPDNFMIGSTPAYGGFAGTLDEVVVFGRALDPEEIAAVMQGDIPQTP